MTKALTRGGDKVEWSKFITYNMAPDKAFESLCNSLFENWCEDNYDHLIKKMVVINGSGGDGGIESYAELLDGRHIAVQAKWFRTALTESQFTQIKKSIDTALKIRPDIIKYIVCIPRNVSSITGRSKGKRKDEEQKWTNLSNSYKEKYKELEIELWDEYRIEKELSKSKNAGLLKFWFTNSQIDRDSIVSSLEKAKSSWLSTKYVPDLNLYGGISNTILNSLGDLSVREPLIKDFKSFYNLCIDLKDKIDSLSEVYKEKEVENIDFLENIINIASSVIFECEKAVESLCYEYNGFQIIKEDVFNIDFEDLSVKVRSLFSDKYYFHMHEAQKIFIKLAKYDSYALQKRYSDLCDKRNLFIVGNPGTGKTHGIASISERLLNDGTHIPIVICANQISDNQKWQEILINYLGLSNTWSEDELFQGLISLANLNKSKNNNTTVNIIPKVIIFVDALDETKNINRWNERIGEAVAITHKYPQIRFCFTSRHICVNDIMKNLSVYHLSSDGDVPVHKLYATYLSTYNIRIINNSWLKYSIRTPLLLKLFCELNKGKVIDSLAPADVSMSNLWRENIKMIENEYAEKTNSFDQAQSVLRSISLLSREFLYRKEIELTEVAKLLLPITDNSLDKAYALLKFMHSYGILGYRFDRGIGADPDKYYYQRGIQGYFDYVEALTLLKNYNHPSEIDFEKHSNINVDTLYSLVILSMCEYDYLLTRNKTIESIKYQWLTDDLQWLGLINTNHKNGSLFVDKTLEFMKSCTDGLMAVTNKLVLPLARDLNHPLGASLLDEFLSSFDAPAKRDILWSIPSYLRDSYNTRYYTSERYLLDDEGYELSNDDEYLGLPLIYAWSLSSVNNINRKKYRKELTTWALLSPRKFYKLFLHLHLVNDPQIISELFAILTCVAYEIADNTLLLEIGEFIKDNVLGREKIDIVRDVSVRYYSIAILYRCISKGIYQKEELSEYLPPYKAFENSIDINQDAFEGSRMGGYRAINYDLSRYVLIDPIQHNFNGYKSHNQLDKLVNEILNDKGYSTEISTDQFILGAAYAYLIRTGWNEDEFYYTNKTSKGIDVLIKNTYSFATHGAKSSVMTICEKYIWQFRNYLFAFLSDRLPFGDECVSIEDYGIIDDFLISIQEIEQIYSPDSLADEVWYIPEKQLVVFDNIISSSKEAIELIHNSPEIDWEKWIFVDNSGFEYKIDSSDLLALNMFSCFYGKAGIETCLFVNTLLIDAYDIDDFINQIKSNNKIIDCLSHPTEWSGGIQSSCYITPKEACWFTWKERFNSDKIELFNDIEIESSVDECTCNYLEVGDVHYDYPSPKIRSLFNINDTDGYLFYDDNRRVKAQYYVCGDTWGTSQKYLLVDKSELLDKLKYSKKAIVWIMREQRRESGLAKEKYGNFWAEKSNSYIAYLKNGKLIKIRINYDMRSGN